MSKPSITFAMSAVLVLGASACERKTIERDAKDVEEAREQVKEEQQELQEELREVKTEGQREVEAAKAELREQETELALEIQSQLDKAEKRFATLDEQATVAAKTLDPKTGPGAELTEAHTHAKAKIEAARSAKTEVEMKQALHDAEQALDKLDAQLSAYRDAV